MLTASASGPQGELCSGVELYRADSFDTAFSGRYPSSDWPRDDTLHFKMAWRGSLSADSLQIRNESDRVVPCLQVFVSDLLLVMNIKRGDVIDLQVNRQPGGTLYFATKARSGNKIIAEASRSIDRSAYGVDVPVTYTVTVANERIDLGVAASASKPGS